MSKSLEARIYAFKVIHGNRYDYSRFTEESPIVVCRIHGPFKVSIANHMKGKVHCRDCSKITRLRKRRRELIPKLEGWLPEGHSLVSVSDDLKKFTMACQNGRLERGAGSPREGVFRCELCATVQRDYLKSTSSKPERRNALARPATQKSHEELIVRHVKANGARYVYQEFDSALKSNQMWAWCRVRGHGMFMIDGSRNKTHCCQCKETELKRRRIRLATERWSKFRVPGLQLVNIDYPRITFVCKRHDLRTEIRINNLRSNSLICPLCVGELSRLRAQKDLLRKFKAAHGDRYDYSQVDYKGAGMKVIIVCRKHGPWETLPGNHYQGSGCWKCFSGASSVPERAWMKAIGDELGQSQTTTARVKGRRGGVCEADATFQNVVIEFDGAYWHGLPGSAAKDEYKNVELTNAGYHVIRLRNMLPPVAGALCFTVTEDPDPKTVTRVVELVRELQEQSVA